jgi:SAM-dependent methyltransferase
MNDLTPVIDYFQMRFEQNGVDASGVDWNSVYAQETRFEQLAKIILPEKPYTVLDYGCGYGAMAEWFRRAGYNFDHYYGYDIVKNSLEVGSKMNKGDSSITFHSSLEEIPVCDYLVASGVFNIKLEADYEEWTSYVIESLETFHKKTSRGFSVNFLTSYSDADRMAERPDLYYADPCRIFDYCRRHFSRNVALLHDYKIWDFTILVRKEYD